MTDKLTAAIELVTSLYDSGDLSSDQACPILDALEVARGAVQSAKTMADALQVYFNKRGAAHALHTGNEDIRDMADALSEWGAAEHKLLSTPTPTTRYIVIYPCGCAAAVMILPSNREQAMSVGGTLVAAGFRVVEGIDEVELGCRCGRER